MKTIYLDFNIFESWRRGEQKTYQLDEHIKRLKGKIYYSPAHIEDIATVSQRYKPEDFEKMVQEKLEFISKKTSNRCILPYLSNGYLERRYPINRKFGQSFLTEEYPNECYSRVVDNYKRNDYAESVNRENMEINSLVESNISSHKEILDEIDNEKLRDYLFNYWVFSCKYQRVENNVIIDITNGDMDKEFKEIKLIKSFLNKYRGNEILSKVIYRKDVLSKKFELFSADFKLIEIMIECLFNIIESKGFYRENIDKKKKKIRSRLHDITHAIYGSYFDFFITSDKKLAHKAYVIYKSIGSRTIVYLLEDNGIFTDLGTFD